jgi:cellulose synthase/poly-beta-1,6-N-acetylglucosamine synthase-like glycosyltransferase
MLLALIILGTTGILGMTILFPLLAGLFSRGKFSGEVFKKNEFTVKSLSILIPAYNENEFLIQTFNSIKRAVLCLKDNYTDLKINILVGADGGLEPDLGAHLVSAGAEVVISSERRGKWNTLCSLASREMHNDWLIFADCGVGWPSDFLIKLVPFFQNKNVMGIAPTYSNPSGGLVERFLWNFERMLKKLESSCGGPVTVHGATVCYRTSELLPVLQILKKKNWLNDDVVLPLSLRGFNPDKKIIYFTDSEIYEFPKQLKGRSFKRRRRMLYGNLQWIKELWIPICTKNSVAGLLASRRVFRVFWIYWLLICALGSALLLVPQASALFLTQAPLVFILAAALITLLFFAATRASLLAPLYLFSFLFFSGNERNGGLPSWK